MYTCPTDQSRQFGPWRHKADECCLIAARDGKFSQTLSTGSKASSSDKMPLDVGIEKELAAQNIRYADGGVPTVRWRYRP